MAMTTSTETTLASIGFTEEDSRNILKKAEIRIFPKDAIILKNGQRCESLYIILEGRVKAFVIDSQGQQALIANYGTGDYFGDIGFSERPQSASIMAVKPSRFLILPSNDLKAMLTKNHLFAERIIEKLVREVDFQAGELSEALQQQAAINEILRAISSSPSNLKSLLEAVVNNAARLCDVTDAAIMRVEGDRLRMVAKHGPLELWPIGTHTRPINRNWVNGRAVLDRKPIHIHDLCAAEAEFPEGSAYAKQHGTRTVFVTPLMREGSAIGTIFVRRFYVKPFTDKQIALLMAFADQVAIAIENVRLFNEIKKKNRKLKGQTKELNEWNATLESRVTEQVARLEQFAKLEHELTLASDIQKSMLPRSIPRFQGYEFCAHMIPAKSVGGDFFDFIPMGSDSLAIAIGDVSDKGVPAALFMAMVRSLLRAEAHPGNSPQEVLQRVNRHIMGMNDKEMFVTILFGILNRTTGKFSYARAGHEPPVLFDGNGSNKRLPKTNGQALGLFDSITVDEQTIEFSQNCMMLLYTDGLPDATNPQNKRFGLNQIIRTISRIPQLSAPIVCTELIKAVIKHQGDGLQFDDMTVIVVRAV
jgi:serine phosphatase RsbU (regulator of sigma subunit)/CRP-like cAMP-binding protein